MEAPTSGLTRPRLVVVVSAIFYGLPSHTVRVFFNIAVNNIAGLEI
jgi:hypothetical protein